MKLTLAKTLRVKNRIVSAIRKASREIARYNSLPVDTKREINVTESLAKRAELVNTLIELKAKLSEANVPIQADIFRLAEAKGDIVFLGEIPTFEGTTHEYGREQGTAHESVIKKEDVDKQVKVKEDEIEAIQDKLDKHNATVTIDIADFEL